MTVKLDSWLLEVLACPNCGGRLEADDAAAELVCAGPCHYAYPVLDDIPVLLVDEARTPAP
ncbi:Trm112 family protein [Actinomadura atramentaria]|uniref:Trm112 family protein n=1 Tax=Actinomadura atramentaria TaxID=1990 RepID=UPI00037450BF|nr:Trm112 family protein [Actinomadura atramentaria]